MKEKRKFNWTSGLFIIGYHLAILALLPVYIVFFGAPSVALISISAGLLLCTGLSITAGYHRLFSHLAYKTNKFIEVIYLIFGTMACQGSAIRWGHDHRLHHAHIDQEEDPYSVKSGFWHAHILWMFREQPPVKEKVVADLLRNPLLRFQHKYYELLMIASNLGTTLFIGWLTGDYFGAFVFAWLIRQFFLHHFTWFINSLAHYVGHQNYSTEHSAVDNYLVSFLTFGEGYHNYHHTFSSDYRNGTRWYHFDPTKWLIWTLSKLGLATGLRKIPQAKITEQMIAVHKEALLDKLKSCVTSKRSELEQKIVYYTENLTRKITEMNQLIAKYKEAKKTQFQIPEALKNLALEIHFLKRSLKYEWKSWKRFSKMVMRLQAQAA